MDIPLQPKQLELAKKMFNSQATWLGYGGARGGSKSAGGQRSILTMALSKPGVNTLIMRRKWKDVKENHLEEIFRHFNSLRKYYVATDHTLVFPNRSKILFGYAEHPTDSPGSGEIHDFQGHQYAAILMEEATQFTQYEMQFMKLCCRWPSDLTITPKMILTCNPGGRGHNFIKRIFIDRKYEGTERAKDYDFIRAFAWDNVEWVRKELMSRGLKASDYYAMSDAERKELFLAFSDYGIVLGGLKGKMRMAHLDGDWDAFQGQFFDVWDESDHVVRAGSIKIEPWWPKWISMDWGYEHNTAVYWHTQMDSNVTLTYRELVVQHSKPDDTAQAIIRLSGGEAIGDFYLSPDAFDLSRRKWQSNDTIADLITKALKGSKVPAPVRADDERIGGAMLMYQMLSNGLWLVYDCCPRLIQCIPEMQRDELDREDVTKIDANEMGEGGDDPYDSARYGLKSRQPSQRPPLGVRVDRKLASYEREHGMVLEPTSRAMMTRQARRIERQRVPLFRRFRPGRVMPEGWRPESHG